MAPGETTRQGPPAREPQSAEARFSVLGTMRDHPWILVVVILLMNGLSFLDGYFTAAELGLGLAREGNIVLDAIARVNPWYAVAVKLGSVLLVSVGIWHGRRHRSVLALSLVALLVFGVLAAYHWGYLHELGYL